MGKRILVYRLGAMGDILFTTPLLRALKQVEPDCCITYVCLKKWAFLLRRNPHVDRIHPVEYSHPKTLGKLGRETFDLVLNLMEGEQAAQSCAALQAREYRGNRWDGETVLPDAPTGLLISRDKEQRIALSRQGISAPELFARAAGIPVKDWRFFFEPGAWARWRGNRRLAHLPRPFVAIHCHSRGSQSRNWPVEHLRETLSLLPEVFFLILGYKKDRDHFAPLAANHVGLDYSSMPVQAVLLSHCDLFVGIDSGPRQMATAMGAPVLWLSGPTAPNISPLMEGEGAYEVPRECAPCFEENCPRNEECLSRISPADLARAIRERLEN